jgi:hypothetical protein
VLRAAAAAARCGQHGDATQPTLCECARCAQAQRWRAPPGETSARSRAYCWRG